MTIQLDDLVTKLILDSSGFTTGVTGAKTQATGLQTGLTTTFKAIGASGVLAFASVTGAITGTIAFLRSAYTETMTYFDAIREMSALNGTTAEETARIIRVAEDHKISIEEVNLASKTMAKEGLSMTVENLAAMSEAYLALETPAEKQAFLMQNFGARGGTAFVLLMQDGAKAIRDQATAVNEGLVPNQTQLDQQLALVGALNDVTTAWDEMKIELGTEFIPTLLELAKALLPIVQLINTLVNLFMMKPLPVMLGEWIGGKAGGNFLDALKLLPSNPAQTGPGGRGGAGGGAGNLVPVIPKGERDNTTIIINNPTGETSEASVNRALATQSYLGNRR